MKPSQSIFKTPPTHSIYCRGYRGVGREWDHLDCSCGATILYLIALIEEMERNAAVINQNIEGLLADLRSAGKKALTKSRGVL